MTEPTLDERLMDAFLYGGLIHCQGTAKPIGLLGAASGIDDRSPRAASGHASLIGKQKQDAISEGDVLEVKYLYVGANGRLYQTRIVRKRDDKPAQECTDAQLVHVNKTVMEKLP